MQFKIMKRSLRKVIYKQSLISSLIPVLSVEIILLILYFGISSFLLKASLSSLTEEVRYHAEEISTEEAALINVYLKEISKLANILQEQHQLFFQNPNNFSLPYEKPEFAVADNGVFYKKNNNGGASLYYSSKTKIDEYAKNKALGTESFDPLLKSLVKNNPNIVSAYFNSYDDMNRLYPFIENVAAQYGEHISMEEFNFYYEADAEHNPNRSPVWTDAYLDPAGHGWMISCVVPIYKQDFLEGVSGIDVTIDKIVTNLLNKKLAWNAKIFLVNQSGMILAMPEKIEELFDLKELKNHVYGEKLTSTITKPEDYNLLKNKNTDLVKKIMPLFDKTENLIELNIKNHDYFLSQGLIQETGWKLFVLIDKNEITQNINNLDKQVKNIGIFIIFGMLVFYCLFFFYLMWQSKRLAIYISKPISQLASNTSQIQLGVYYKALPSYKSDIIEIDELNENFSKMTVHLQTLFSDLQQANNTLEQKVVERTAKLSEALENLKKMQQNLIQSEKMAALGQLIANIAHEINTPLGVINASISNIETAFKQTLQKLPSILKHLSDAEQLRFVDFIEEGIKGKNLSTREERQAKKNLLAWTQQQQIAHNENVVTSLVNSGVIEETCLQNYMALLKHSQNVELFEMAYQLIRQHKNSDNIKLAIERASKIVFALKNYSRLEENSEKAKINVIETIETALMLYHNQLKQNIEVIKEFESLPEIDCYPDELNQVWTNLIHNALQAMNYKGILEIQAIKQNNEILVKISDNGSGISPELFDKIFEPFFTTKPRGEGTGLGLDIVQRIIKKHDGNIMVESGRGKTTFTVVLPIKETT